MYLHILYPHIRMYFFVKSLSKLVHFQTRISRDGYCACRLKKNVILEIWHNFFAYSSRNYYVNLQNLLMAVIGTFDSASDGGSHKNFP